MRTLAVIPAYNEEASIASVISSVRRHFDGNIAVVDDGSLDDTASVARRTGAVVLSHPCNLGIGAAVQTGFKYAEAHDYDAVVRIDGDGQHDPSYIPVFLDLLARDEADIIVGSRFLARKGYQSSVVRRIGILILSVLSALVGARVTDPTSGYWALSRKAFRLLQLFQPDDYPEAQGLLIASRAGCRIREIPVIMQARNAGRSSIRGAVHSGFYMLKVILSVLVQQLRR